MIIREFSEHDSPALRDIYLRCRIFTFKWLDTSPCQLNDFDVETSGERIWVAECNGVVAGFISVWVSDNFIHHLFVAPGYQKQGIGKALLGSVTAKFVLPLKLKCLIKNEGAVAFYQSQGWRVLSTGDSTDGAYLLMSNW